MKSIESRLEKLEKRMNSKINRSNKRLYINIRDEKYKDMFTDDYLEEHYPGYQNYIILYLPDNGRGGNIDNRPYTITED